LYHQDLPYSSLAFVNPKNDMMTNDVVYPSLDGKKEELKESLKQQNQQLDQEIHYPSIRDPGQTQSQQEIQYPSFGNSMPTLNQKHQQEIRYPSINNVSAKPSNTQLNGQLNPNAMSTYYQPIHNAGPAHYQPTQQNQIPANNQPIIYVRRRGNHHEAINPPNIAQNKPATQLKADIINIAEKVAAGIRKGGKYIENNWISDQPPRNLSNRTLNQPKNSKNTPKEVLAYTKIKVYELRDATADTVNTIGTKIKSSPSYSKIANAGRTTAAIATSVLDGMVQALSILATGLKEAATGVVKKTYAEQPATANNNTPDLIATQNKQS